MIRAIGFQRFMIIMFLIGVSTLMGVFQFTMAIPKKRQAYADLQAVQSQTSTLKTELENMQTNMHIFEARKNVFKEMEQKEFFGTQDRADARDRVERIQKLSKILNAKYEIRPAVIEEQDVPETFEYTVIKSDVKIQMTAVDDTDIYRFIYYLNYGFPGHVVIKDLSMVRNIDIDENILKEIGGGTPPTIVEATLDLEWRTMARKDEVDIAPEPEGRGDLPQ